MEESKVRWSAALSLQYNAVLVRHGSELGVKSSKTRQKMVRILNDNILMKTKNLGVHNVRNIMNRSLVYGGDPIAVVQYITTYISGVHSASPIIDLPASDYSTILDVGTKYALMYLTANCSFGVRVRRAGKQTYSSMDLARELGSAIYESASKTMANIYIDLTNPRYWFHVEVKGDHTFIYHQVFDGWDGLPAGCEGKIFGTIRPWEVDFIASCMLQRRGVDIFPLYFDTGIDTNDPLKKVKTFFEESLSPIAKKFNTNKKNISLEEAFLHKWKDILPKEELCLGCHLFIESVGQYICILSNKTANKSEMFGIVDGLSLRDINTNMLKFLEEEHMAPIFRPLLLSSPELNLPVFKKYENNSGHKSCCKIQDKRYITTVTPSLHGLKNEILKDARICAEKYIVENLKIYNEN